MHAGGRSNIVLPLRSLTRTLRWGEELGEAGPQASSKPSPH